MTHTVITTITTSAATQKAASALAMRLGLIGIPTQVKAISGDIWSKLEDYATGATPRQERLAMRSARIKSKFHEDASLSRRN